MLHERVFHMEINPDGSRPISDALNAIFTLKGSGVGPGHWSAPLEWSDSNVSLAQVSTPA